MTMRIRYILRMTTHIAVKSRQEQIVEARFDATIPELLRVLYTVDGLSQQAVADKLGVHRSTVVRWMRDHGVATRDRRAVAA
jgi:DNA-binding XRE family transcriptional regulator